MGIRGTLAFRILRKPALDDRRADERFRFFPLLLDNNSLESCYFQVPLQISGNPVDPGVAGLGIDPFLGLYDPCLQVLVQRGEIDQVVEPLSLVDDRLGQADPAAGLEQSRQQPQGLDLVGQGAQGVAPH